MPGEDIEKGDKVSWNWGGGAPGGKVAEKKTEGEVAIKSKRGNTIKKNAEPNNPAVHIERSGNDVVKKASELNVESKGSGGADKGKKREHEDEGEEEKEDKKEDEIVQNTEGKDVRAGGKKQKTEPKKAAAKKDDKKDEKKEEKKEEKEDKKVNGEAAPKKAGRPKKAEGATAKSKVEKEKKSRSTEGIGSRTRSQQK